MKPLVLVIEGKRAARPSFSGGLLKKGFEVESVPNGSSAIKYLKKNQPHAIVIDADSMRTTGSRICQSVRNAVTETPIVLVLSQDSRVGSNNTADEVLNLPFTLQKLVNRLRPFITMDQNKMLEVGSIKLDLDQRWVHCNGKKTRLTPRLFRLMKTLMKKPGVVHQREELFRKIWETEYFGDMRSLDVHISWLRRAVEDNPRNPKYIKTERGVGYYFVGESDKK
ncbi:MAG TPA: response regulator transcription factor [Anaerolineae bacterium]|nr:response regulator transcription factor [Anaerolineae bacterium]